MWALLSIALAAGADAPGAAPPAATSAREERQAERLFRDGEALTQGPMDATGHLFLRFWQEVVSPGDGARCPLRPTCSAYAAQAMGRDGLASFPLIFDRLMSDGATRGLPLADDGFHHLDPLADHPPALQLLSGRYCRRQLAAGADYCV